MTAPRPDCRAVRELLPWWVNDTLDEAERRRVDEHLGSCEACRAELDETRFALAAAAQHLPTEALVAHAAGQDPGVDSELFETHLARCSECAGELALLRESREALFDETPSEMSAAEQDDMDGRDDTGGKILAWSGRERPAEHRAGGPAAWRWGAAAAAVLAVVAGYGALGGYREAARLAERVAELEAPRANVALVDLYPDDLVLREGTSAAPPAEMSASADRATLILNSRQPPSSGPFRIEIRDAGGRTVAVVDGLRTDADGLLTLSFGRADFDGELLLVLLRSSAEPSEPLEAYRLRM